MTSYIRPYPKTWWLERRPYFFFVIREFTSLFVAGYCLFLLVLLFKLGDSREPYTQVVSFLQSPVILVVHIIFFIFVFYHAFSWFNLTPKILVLHLGEDRVPEIIISGAVYLAWIAVSILIYWLIFGALSW